MNYEMFKISFEEFRNIRRNQKDNQNYIINNQANKQV
jgi:hypothetical protein